ncbi:MAG TPA: PilN domain-containing protein [Burkholderiales bacterium]
MSQQLNLFNPVFLRQKKYFSAVTMVQCLGIVLVALIAMYGFQRWQLVGLENQLVEAEAQFKTTQQQLTKFGAAKRNPSKALEDEATRLEAQVKAQEALLGRLDSDELGNAEGFSRYLNALARQTVAGVWITGFTATGTEGPLMIRGRLLQPELLPTYLRMLNREETLRGHGFAELQLITHEEKTQAASGEAAAARYVEFTLGATKPANRGRP